MDQVTLISPVRPSKVSLVKIRTMFGKIPVKDSDATMLRLIGLDNISGKEASAPCGVMYMSPPIHGANTELLENVHDKTTVNSNARRFKCISYTILA